MVEAAGIVIGFALLALGGATFGGWLIWRDLPRKVRLPATILAFGTAGFIGGMRSGGIARAVLIGIGMVAIGFLTSSGESREERWFQGPRTVPRVALGLGMLDVGLLLAIIVTFGRLELEARLLAAGVAIGAGIIVVGLARKAQRDRQGPQAPSFPEETP